MNTRDQTAAPGTPSTEAVERATGRNWKEWLELLDREGAADWNHKEIVGYLEREHADTTSSWWRQSITVGYEKARGKRVLGQTAEAGFEVGVRRTMAATPAALWELITSRPELWLGEGADVDFEVGARYRVPPHGGSPGASGQVRVVKPVDRLRMTWQPEGWAESATLQLTLSASGSGKTAVQVYAGKLPDAAAREEMRTHLRGVLERLEQAVAHRG